MPPFIRFCRAAYFIFYALTFDMLFPFASTVF